MTSKPVICANGIWTPPVKETVATPNGRRVRVVTPGVLTPWRSNADLIARGVVGLGYLTPEMRVLDPTFGKGVWWKDWSPGELVHSDLRQDGVDFRALPHPDGSFDAVAFDPPYVQTGGKATSTVPSFNDQYGLGEHVETTTPSELSEMNDAGLVECARVVAPGGVILMKAANYVWSGRLTVSAHRALNMALMVGLVIEDWFIYTGPPGMQPERTRKCAACAGSGVDARPGNAHGEPCIVCSGSGRTESPQAHARQNFSTLYVLRRPRVRRAPSPKTSSCVV